ncbi:MAG TPA: PfkB family carbohydrate kinase, partial [Planctomycetota bacterium]|nr:PfkB family carbohydrate kinase [Planctomycetota bacterium]
MTLQLTTARLNGYFQQFRNLKIAVIGDLMLDQYLQGSVKRISPEAPIPIVRVETDTCRPGGAANVALNLVRQGARCSLVGVSGQDRHRGELLACLKAGGIDGRGVVADPQGTTIVKTRVLARQQQLLRIDHEAYAAQVARTGRSPAVEKQLIARARQAIAGADAVVLSDYVKGCLTPGLFRAVLAQAKRRRI